MSRQASAAVSQWSSVLALKGYVMFAVCFFILAILCLHSTRPQELVRCKPTNVHIITGICIAGWCLLQSHNGHFFNIFFNTYQILYVNPFTVPTGPRGP